MALSKKPYKGCRDFFPKDKRIQDFIFDKMKNCAELYGYEPYDGPMVEEVELYKAKSGEELINDQIYSFEDRGKRNVAIRPEMTPTLARMVAQVYREEAKPIRYYAIPNLMRYERPQKGRLREHWQFNCDIFGAPGRTGEVEILQVAVRLLRNFGANENHFEILLNDRAIVDCVFNDLMKLEDDTAYKLYKIVDQAKKLKPEDLQKKVDELNLEESQTTLFHQYLKLKNFDEVIEFLSANDRAEIADQLSGFTKSLKTLNLDKFVVYDPSIVRGLDYYTGIVFEIFDKNPENRRAICGGGAYANLLQIFNEGPLAGVGFGLGDVTLTDFLTTHNLLPDLEKPTNDLVITFQDEEASDSASTYAEKLRETGLKVYLGLEPLKFKKVFSLAEKKGAKFVAMMGSDELANHSIQIKNLETKEQHELPLNDIEEFRKLL